MATNKGLLSAMPRITAQGALRRHCFRDHGIAAEANCITPTGHKPEKRGQTYVDYITPSHGFLIRTGRTLDLTFALSTGSEPGDVILASGMRAVHAISQYAPLFVWFGTELDLKISTRDKVGMCNPETVADRLPVEAH